MQDLERHMLELYTQMYKKYFEERRLIPKGNLVEIRYEDFIAHPVENVEKIYTTLGLNGFEASKKQFIEYATSQKCFKASSYTVEPAVREKLKDKWKFVFDEYGYEM